MAFTDTPPPRAEISVKAPRLGLALSGGGTRAAVFHLGVLRRLAAEGALERVTHLSTVSGGSLITAVIMAQAEMRWPTSAEYECQIYPRVRQLLTTTDLFSLRAIGLGGVIRFNRRLLTHRASVLADLLEAKWGVTGNLEDLPTAPVWWINTHCLHTGKNWRFARGEMGDWKFGLHHGPSYRLAQAAAASAAVPYAIGALTLDLPKEGWFDVDRRNHKASARRESPTTERVRLWDGGAYENLGLEALYKPGQPLRHCDFLICSDASAELPLDGRSSLLGLLGGRLSSPRLFDITSDQIRALRSRMFFRDVLDKTVRGALIKMGLSTREIDIQVGRERPPEDYDAFQSDAEARRAHLHPTDLTAMVPSVFDRIARHGFEMADTILTTHSPKEFAACHSWPASLEGRHQPAAA